MFDSAWQLAGTGLCVLCKVHMAGSEVQARKTSPRQTASLPDVDHTWLDHAYHPSRVSVVSSLFYSNLKFQVSSVFGNCELGFGNSLSPWNRPVQQAVASCLCWVDMFPSGSPSCQGQFTSSRRRLQCLPWVWQHIISTTCWGSAKTL